MGTELTLGTNGKAALPAHLQKRAAERAGNVVDMSLSVPSLTFGGKVFSVNLGAEKTKLMSRNEEGDETPVSTLPIVILGFNTKRGRSFYEGAYDADNVAPPRCFSEDGVRPDATVEEPIASLCSNCPNAVKGSRVTPQGTQTVACSEHRLLCIALAGRNGIKPLPPLRLKLSQTSDYDGRSKALQEKGQFAFSNFMGHLKTRGIDDTTMIVTKITFDPNVDYPKLTFRADRWLTEEETGAIAAIEDSGEIEKVLAGRGGTPPAAPALAAPTEPKTGSGGAAATAPKAAEAPKPETAAAKKKRLAAEAAAKAAAEAAATEEDAGETTAGGVDMSDVGDAGDETGPGVVVEEEEDEDDKAIRLAQERKAAKAAAAKAANGTKPATTAKAADAKPSNKPVEAKPAENLSADVAGVLDEWE